MSELGAASGLTTGLMVGAVANGVVGGLVGVGLDALAGAGGTATTVLSGHGGLSDTAGTFTLPEGTSFTQWTGVGNPISNSFGNAIETGADVSGFTTEMVGAQSYLPGAQVPNFTLGPPEGLNIMGNPVTVTEPTALQDLIRPGMGNVQWAACCSLFH